MQSLQMGAYLERMGKEDEDAFPLNIVYFYEKYKSPERQSISIGNVLFIKSGEALCHSIDVGKIDGFWKIYYEPFRQQKISTSE